jgi:hypothetical protein
MLELWQRHDYGALEKLGGFAHDRVYVSFIALVYTAMTYMPARFAPGQPPFHVVTHQRDYLALRQGFGPGVQGLGLSGVRVFFRWSIHTIATVGVGRENELITVCSMHARAAARAPAAGCSKDVPRGSRFNPCPSSRDYAPILNFGTGLKSGDVFPSAVTMPHPEFINAVLCNTVAASNATGAEAAKAPLGLNEDHLGQVVHAGEALIGWDERVSVVSWRGTDVPFVPGMPFGTDREEGDTCKALLRDVLQMSKVRCGVHRACTSSSLHDILMTWASARRARVVPVTPKRSAPPPPRFRSVWGDRHHTCASS